MKKKQIYALIFLSLLSLSCQAESKISVYEDLLYWHTSQQPTSVWAYQFTPIPSNNPSFPSTQSSYFTEPNVSFGWNTGLRLGALYAPNDYFDGKLAWTNFSSHTNASVIAPNGQVLLSEFFNGFTTESLYNRAQLDWTIKLNMIDFQVGHQFMPLASLSLHPYLGVKGGTINQTIDSSWQFNIANIEIYRTTEKLNNNFSGVGPSFGVSSLWSVYKALGIRANFETALLWGRWSVKDTFVSPGLLPTPARNINSDTTVTSGAFTASYFLGLEWAFQTKLPVRFNLGYEMQFWSNQLRLPLFQALPVHGDLTLQGGTCGIYIDLS